MSGSLCERMRAAADGVWRACLEHPFVRGIGDGTLPADRFRYFMIQDYLYLLDYARVFAMGVIRARDPEQMRFFAANVGTILEGEMNIHRAYMQRLGIADEQVRAAQPAPANRAYTGYMLAVAEAGTPADIVAAILACSWSYAEIGQALASLPGAAEHPLYGEWIRGYASEDYAATNAALMARMEKLAEGLDEDGLARLTAIFVECSRYELGFWDMAWRMKE